MKKELRFSAKLDTTEFDRTVDQLQRKIKEIYRGSDISRQAFENKARMGQIGLGPGVTPADRIRTDIADVKTRRELDAFIKQQVRDQEKLSQTINKQLDAIRQLKKEQENLAKDSQERVKNEEKIRNIEKEISENRARSAAKEKTISAALDQRKILQERLADPSRIIRGYQVGGIRGAISAAQAVYDAGGGIRGFLPTIGGGLNMLAGSVGVVGSEIGSLQYRPVQMLENRAIAVQLANERIRRAFEGRNYENIIYRREMGEASRIAESAVQSKQTKDRALFAASVLLLGGGLLSLTGVGTAPGLAMIGAGASVLGGAYGVLKKGGAVGIGPYAEQYRTEIEAIREEARRRAFEQQKNLNVLKRISVEDFQSNLMQNLQMQRALGFSDEEMFQRYRQGTEAGFTRDMIRDAMIGILGAGGSTRAARESAGFVLGLERDYDITNARQLLGRLSGTIGGAAQSEQSLIRILAEGSRQGLDKSEFREENRKFAQQIAEVAYRSGVKTESGVADIAAFQGAFLADRTTRGLEAAATTSEFVRRLQSKSTGVRGAMEAGFLLENLPNLSVDELMMLSEMSIADIASMSPERKRRLARYSGKTPEEFDRIMQEIKFKKAIGYNPDILEATGIYRTLSEKVGPLDPKEQRQLEEAERILESAGARYGITGQPEMESFSKYLKTGQIDRATQMIISGTGGQTGRVGDIVTADRARFENLANIMQQEFVPGVQMAAKESIAMAESFKKAKEIFDKARTDEEMLQAAKKMAQSLFGLGIQSDTQPQAGTGKQ